MTYKRRYLCLKFICFKSDLNINLRVFTFYAYLTVPIVMFLCLKHNKIAKKNIFFPGIWRLVFVPLHLPKSSLCYFHSSSPLFARQTVEWGVSLMSETEVVRCRETTFGSHVCVYLTEIVVLFLYNLLLLYITLTFCVILLCRLLFDHRENFQIWEDIINFRSLFLLLPSSV